MEAVLTDLLPLFPLGTVLFSGMVLPLHIFEERYRTMVARQAEADPMFGVVLTRSGREVADQPEIHAIGTAASLLKAVRYGDGRYDIAVRGGRRFEVVSSHWDEGYLTGTVKWLDDDDPVGAGMDEAMRLAGHVRRAFNAYLDALARTTGARAEHPDLGRDPRALAYAICSMMPFSTARRQGLLEAPTSVHLLAELLAALRHERQLLVTTGIGGATIDHPGRRFSTN